MKTRFKFSFCAAAALLIASSTHAQILFEGDNNFSHGALINEFTPGGVQSLFASGLSHPNSLAIEGVTLPVPEPSLLGILGVGILGLSILRQRRH